MARGEPVRVAVDDVVQMRRPHPCGGFEWAITRVGSDIGMRCLTCGRRVMLPRARFEKRLKRVVGRPDAAGVDGQQ
ncbi:MAG: DUF951 domain-containing protein [Anaerolineae bacterium]|nr:DUF951 domain-containing protein [Anaerolineae bacterium]